MSSGTGAQHVKEGNAWSSPIATGVPSSAPSSCTSGLLFAVEHEHMLKHRVNGIPGKDSVECMDVKANAKAKAAKVNQKQQKQRQSAPP